jgi:hypothetical protein
MTYHLTLLSLRCYQNIGSRFRRRWFILDSKMLVHDPKVISPVELNSAGGVQAFDGD